MKYPRIRLVCRHCRKQMDTLEWLETGGRLQLLGAGPHRWRAACWWDHLPDGADRPPTRLRYDCHRHGRRRHGIVGLVALEAAYTKAAERGDSEILLPL